MSDYIKATNFTSKDTLPTGNAAKIVKGTELDAEFTAIASAVSSKANSDNALFTGVPTAPTAVAGTANSQLATTSFVTSERTNTATLTNKTLTSPTINTPTISGGTITGITDLAVADGGTGVSTIAANAVVLGNGTSGIQTVAPSTAGNILASDGTTWTSVPGNIGIRGQVFTSNGTFTIPAGITALKVLVVGAGNNGGNGADGNSEGNGDNGAGGTSSAVAVKYFTGLTPGSTLAVTVGTSGGAASSIASGTQTITTVSASPSGASGGDINGSGAPARNIKDGAYGYLAAGNKATNGATAPGSAGGVGGLGGIGWGAGGGGGGGGNPTYIGTPNNGGAGGSGSSGLVIFEW